MDEVRTSLVLLLAVAGALLRLDAVIMMWLKRKDLSGRIAELLVLSFAAPVIALIVMAIKDDLRWKDGGERGEPVPLILISLGSLIVAQVCASWNFVVVLFLLGGDQGNTLFFGPDPDQTSFPPHMVLFMVSIYGMVLLPLIVVLLGRERVASFMSTKKGTSTIALGALLLLLVQAGIGLVRYLIAGPESPTSSTLFEPPGDPLAALALIVPIVVLAPLVEEILFRGAIHWGLSNRFGPVPTVVITAALFAIAHMDPATAIPIFFLGSVLGWARYRSGSILPGFVLHSLNNAIALAYLTF